MALHSRLCAQPSCAHGCVGAWARAVHGCAHACMRALCARLLVLALVYVHMHGRLGAYRRA
eukprot:9957812-Alexandrium_andersonii.AAC.1